MNIYEYQGYKAYLQDYLTRPDFRGVKTQLALYLNCQSSFISQVLTGSKTHFSLEHIQKIGSFLKLNAAEMDYLVHLCLYERAGNEELKEYFSQKLENLKRDHSDIKKKIAHRGQNLSQEQKAIYYSHWAYMAIHMLVSIPTHATEDKIEKYLNLPPSFVEDILKFLTECGLIEKHGQKYLRGKTRIHLENNSPFINNLHQNWRQKAIESLPNHDELNLHYSSILVLSKKDAFKIKDLILNLIKEKEVILAPSPEEQMVVFNIDYFKL